jgi:pyrroloquinoline quinone (PQQ) biosynthesis protein C
MQAQAESKEGSSYPRLRENIWHLEPESDTAILITSRANYEVDRNDALKFFQMRSYCTGRNSIDEIARKSGLPVQEVQGVLAALTEVGVVRPQDAPELSPVEVRQTLMKVCNLWSEELRIAYIGNEFLTGQLPKTVLLGWLVEMYHYINDFPLAIEHGARHATGKLREVLVRYAQQETGHQHFVTRTLVNLGVKREEVVTATPLLATRTVGLLMRELFELCPAATLMLAALVEAQEFDPEQSKAFRDRLQEVYGVAPETFDPFFEHQEIDVKMRHAELFADHADLVAITDRAVLDQVVNKLHDLKHAFELQSLEIKSYYGQLDGKYFPRQPIEYAAL